MSFTDVCLSLQTNIFQKKVYHTKDVLVTRKSLIHTYFQLRITELPDTPLRHFIVLGSSTAD